MLDLASIRIDGGTQSRTSINTDTVAEYAQALTDGATMPPVVVFFDGADYWLADGFHRFHAFRKAGRDRIKADVRQGTCREARLYAAGANGTHGLRRTNEDKRRAVLMVLEDEDCTEHWTDREIAKHCAVSHPFVAAIRSPEVAARQQAHREESAAKKSQRVESDSTPTAKAVIPAPEKAAEPAEKQAPWEAPEDDGPSANELAIQAAAEAADRALVATMLESDAPLAALAAENKQLKAEIAQLKLARDGYMNRCNEAIALVKARDRQIAKLEKMAKAAA